MKKLKIISVSLAAILSVSVAFAGGPSAGKAFASESGIQGKGQENQSKGFKRVDPQKAVSEMAPGWNLGNTLDGDPNEGDWWNPPAREMTFQVIKDAGFKSIRLPVNFGAHFGPAPDYKIDPAFLDRVEEVVDWGLKRDLYVVMDFHHFWKVFETTNDVITGPDDPNTPEDGATDAFNRLDILWSQIADRFKNKNEKLLFEVMNEPNGTVAQVDEMNRRVLSVIRQSGGYNDNRLVLLPSRWTSAESAATEMSIPKDRNIIITPHWYKPWAFVSGASPTWGTPQERKYTDDTLKLLHDNLVAKGVPVIIGEHSTGVEHYNRWLYLDDLVGKAAKYGITTMLWDNGAEYYDRWEQTFRDPVAIDVIVNAANRVPNALVRTPDLYFKANAPVEDRSLDIDWNGNKLNAIYHGLYKLEAGKDYKIDGGKVVLKGDYLKSILPLGMGETKSPLRFDFNRGADNMVYVHQYVAPTIGTTAITVKESDKPYQDLTLDLHGNGNGRPKAVTAVENGTNAPIKDDNINLNNGDVWYNADETTVTFSGQWVLGKIDADTTITIEYWSGEKVQIDVSYVP